jgi:hypothetical protein
MFVVGGTLTTEPYSEIDNENLALIDIKKSKCFKKSLEIPVSRAACSIFKKQFLFIAGG